MLVQPWSQSRVMIVHIRKLGSSSHVSFGYVDKKQTFYKVCKTGFIVEDSGKNDNAPSAHRELQHQ